MLITLALLNLCREGKNTLSWCKSLPGRASSAFPSAPRSNTEGIFTALFGPGVDDLVRPPPPPKGNKIRLSYRPLSTNKGLWQRRLSCARSLHAWYSDVEYNEPKLVDMAASVFMMVFTGESIFLMTHFGPLSQELFDKVGAQHMGSNCLIAGHRRKTLIKHRIKSIVWSRSSCFMAWVRI